MAISFTLSHPTSHTRDIYSTCVVFITSNFVTKSWTSSLVVFESAFWLLKFVRKISSFVCIFQQKRLDLLRQRLHHLRKIFIPFGRCIHDFLLQNQKFLSSVKTQSRNLIFENIISMHKIEFLSHFHHNPHATRKTSFLALTILSEKLCHLVLLEIYKSRSISNQFVLLKSREKKSICECHALNGTSNNEECTTYIRVILCMHPMQALTTAL